MKNLNDVVPKKVVKGGIPVFKASQIFVKPGPAEEASWSGSARFAIKCVNMYQ